MSSETTKNINAFAHPNALMLGSVVRYKSKSSKFARKSSLLSAASRSFRFAALGGKRESQTQENVSDKLTFVSISIQSAFINGQIIAIPALVKEAAFRTHIVSVMMDESSGIQRRLLEDANRENDIKRFHKLYSQWQRETRLLSSPIEITRNRAYLGIATMGERAIPLILEHWKSKANHWAWALETITQEFPKSYKNEPEACQYWLEWGRSRNYLV